LIHGVGNYPDGEEIDVALNYGDYYYVEALLRGSRLE
jgi:unsaturated chondroitin disaccharide hydrolase